MKTLIVGDLPASQARFLLTAHFLISKKDAPMHPIEQKVVDVHSQAVAKASGFPEVEKPPADSAENIKQVLMSRTRLRMARFRNRTQRPKFQQDDHNNMQANRVADKKKAKAKKKKTEAMKRRQRAAR